ncbi:MAG: N-acetylglucosaminyl-diphospho-decaprenol L-rhamnosyltransferase [Actinomycetota bacterium]|nr:N-acetylglucosaminyl-diphospho-decaprenol L-rhamnosyltransferase [Actinomycetota bacterium]MDQ1498249.1 N-acetylglucosaminyl-diphospho-decaprenol L-rhamnosyltransferase [Actinomycetota bacterium]
MAPDGPCAAWAAVVVNYNAGEALRACVAAILAEDPRPELVVVDNSSTDGSVEAVLRAFPAVRVVRSGGNLGYARAANLGIAATAAPVVAVLNPDTVLGPGAGAAVVARFAAEPDLGAAGPRLHNPDGTVYPSARRIPSLPDAVGHGLLFFVWRDNPFTRRYRETGADPTRPRDVDWVSGAAVWLRRAALDAVGGWDERYFMYVEDVDLCWRLRRAGWRVAYEPAGTVEHLLGVSTAGRPYRMIAEHHRSLLRFASVRFTGRRRALLGPAAAFLTARGLLAMAHHRFAAPRR